MKVSKLQAALKVHPIFCQLLVQRGIYTYEAAKTFFRPSLDDLHDPFLMRDMDRAIARILKAIANKERILLYGDYDVDGTTSIALSYSFFSKFHSQLDYYIPDRYKEGYGISRAGLDYAQQNNCTLVIAMDCGIKAVAIVKEAKARGIDFIICDHHLPSEKIPAAVAVLDPKRSDCNYPYKELTGCGISFKLIQAYCLQQGLADKHWKSLLDFVAISTACDIVPITGENRVLAFYGLKQLNHVPRLGIKALMEQSARQKPLTIGDLVFGFGPLINAAGRLADAQQAVKLMISRKETIAQEYAKILQQRNQLRKEFEKRITQEAKLALEQFRDWENKKSIVLYNKNWHKGVVGIAAARIVDFYHRPSIILTESSGKVVGSARTVKGFDIYQALKGCEDLLENFGGHAHAAGLTLALENLEAFAKRFEKVVGENIREEELIPEIKISGELDFELINEKFWGILKQFAPFGPQNRNPVFVSKNVSDSGFSRVLKNNHLKFVVQQNAKKKLSGIGFGLGDFFGEMQTRPFQICYNIQENNWNGKTSLQLNVKDVKF
ncbi:MAG TPA: single-stranded-DNA-specific exonuclease RecJ [Saprospiraceae bacterium]|nr:single-stranded-DNA-specific exonuclease RecJ [Saprospiraceae bacterium]